LHLGHFEQADGRFFGRLLATFGGAAAAPETEGSGGARCRSTQLRVFAMNGY